MDDNYLNDLEKVQSQISKHWKANYRKKRKSNKKKYESSDYSSSISEDSEDEHRRKLKDKYALTVQQMQDSRNKYGIIMCGYCKKPGHGHSNC